MLSRLIRLSGLVVGASVLLASGCIFSPERKPPKDIVHTYPTADSPQQTLKNLIDAYNNRDSIATKAVYDPLYQGSSTDPSQPTPLYQFTQLAEVYHVKRLHDDPNIIGVSLDLGLPSTWQVIPGLATDPPGSLVIPIQYAVISVHDVSSSEFIFKPVTMEYAFKPTVTGSTTLWTVIRWTENAQ